MFNPPLQHPGKLYIDGQWVDPSSGSTVGVVSPSTEELYVRVAEANETDIQHAVSAAQQAFNQGPWPRMTPSERAKYLSALAIETVARSEDIASSWSNEMGILYSQAKPFSAGIGGLYDMYSAMEQSFEFEKSLPTTSGASSAMLAYEPVGVVGAIIPWNAPAQLIAMKVAPALLAGCTVVVKSAPEAPSHGLILAEIAHKIGIPKGVLNVVTAGREASRSLVCDPRVDKIAFTGSTAAGQDIASVLSKRTARFTMELGGKSAAIVCDDYDIETAAKTIALTNAGMTGQFCVALSRVIVSRHRHDQLLEALAAEYRSIVVGDPFDPSSEMGPLSSSSLRARVESYISKAHRDGFALAAGGQRPKHLSRGFYLEPTVFGHVDNSSELAQQEIFGPVVAVIPAKDENAAVALANESIYGLNAVVFTNDMTKAHSIARSIRCGTVSHNALRSDLTIGFGGFKQSGVGREGGTQGLLAYLESKTILLG